MNTFIKAVEEESEYYNMKLNKAKCKVIAMNKENKIKFKDNTRVENALKEKYLGVNLSRKALTNIELDNRFAGTHEVLNKLKIFWNRSVCSVKWKIQVYNAAIITKLTYGMESLQINDNQMQRIDAFQQKRRRPSTLHHFICHLDHGDVLLHHGLLQLLDAMLQLFLLQALGTCLQHTHAYFHLQ